jgi:hypothetical protein
MAQALELTAFPDLASQVEAIEKDGFVYFPNYLNSDEVAELRACMDRTEINEASYDINESPEDGGFYHKTINNAFNRDPLFMSFLDKPGIIEFEEAVHGEDCHVIAMTAWMTGPGRPDQKIHADWQPINLPEDILADPRVKIPVFITTVHFYLDEITEEIGPTQFIPGSHRSGRKPNGENTWQGIEPHNIMCHAGDVLAFRSEVWHRGTANSSDQVRHLLQVHYAQRMITQKFPPYLNKFQFDEALLAQATPRQRRLLGEHRRSNYD